LRDPLDYLEFVSADRSLAETRAGFDNGAFSVQFVLLNGFRHHGGLQTVQHPCWPLAALAELIAAGAVWAGEAPPAPDTTTEPIPKTEVGRRAIADFHNATLLPTEQSYPPLDPAALLKYAPGAAVNKTVR
jgi:hypothetical protein